MQDLKKEDLRGTFPPAALFGASLTANL